MPKLRDGTFPQDERLGRLASFDPKSRNFPVRSMLAPGAPLKSKRWRLDPRLDQGSTSSCVGHAWCHDHGAEPGRYKIASPLAHKWYHLAQDRDEWAGSDYEGSSILGGAKAGVAQGFFKEYRWAFSVHELLMTVGYLGPVVVGTNWYRAMFSPDARGLVRIGGHMDGGHAWMVRGVDLAHEEIIASNSWGRDFGVNGDFRVGFADLGRLLEEGGDCAHPVRA